MSLQSGHCAVSSTRLQARPGNYKLHAELHVVLVFSAPRAATYIGLALSIATGRLDVGHWYTIASTSSIYAIL
jgi:hypothetical protein